MNKIDIFENISTNYTKIHEISTIELVERRNNVENSYRFYRNTDCEYFPCHKVENEENFNCMFCYCPLYFLEECGGNYIMNHGIKDCTSCLIPHTPEGYDYINKKIIEENRKRKNEK